MSSEDRCDECRLPGELGANMRAHAIDVPGKQQRTVRLLHVELCTAKWFAKYDAWLAERGKSKS